MSRIRGKSVAQPVLILSLALALSGTARDVAASGLPDEQFTSHGMMQSATFDSARDAVLYFEDNIDNLRMPTLLVGYQRVSNGIPNALTFCRSLEDSACANADYFQYYAVLPACQSRASTDCIADLYAIPDSATTRTAAQFIRYMPETVAHSYTSDSDQLLPVGGNGSIWRLPGILHGGGTDTYAVVISRTGRIERRASGFVDVTKSGRSQDHDFRAAIFPVNLISDDRYRANQAVISNQTGSGGLSYRGLGISHPSGSLFEPCAIVADRECALRETFPSDVRFGLDIRFSKQVSGWLHGRLWSASMSMDRTSEGTSLHISAYAVHTPLAAGVLNVNQLSDADKTDLTTPSLRAGGITYPNVTGPAAIKAVTTLARFVSDQAVANPTQWGFYDLSSAETADAGACIGQGQGISGLVATNATAYSAGPPAFDTITQSLNYTVASLHYLPDGKVAQGTYDLYLSNSVATCLYGTKSVPSAATVSVVDAQGERLVATSSVSVDGDWVHLAARGFTFSSPTLRVRLLQASAAPTAQASPAPTVAAASSPTPTTSAAPPTSSTPATPPKVATTAPKKVSIRCRLGTKTKIVVAVKPACPKGWKRY